MCASVVGLSQIPLLGIAPENSRGVLCSHLPLYPMQDVCDRQAVRNLARSKGLLSPGPRASGGCPHAPPPGRLLAGGPSFCRDATPGGSQSRSRGGAGGHRWRGAGAPSARTLSPWARPWTSPKRKRRRTPPSTTARSPKGASVACRAWRGRPRCVSQLPTLSPIQSRGLNLRIVAIGARFNRNEELH